MKLPLSHTYRNRTHLLDERCAQQYRVTLGVSSPYKKPTSTLTRRGVLDSFAIVCSFFSYLSRLRVSLISLGHFPFHLLSLLRRSFLSLPSSFPTSSFIFCILLFWLRATISLLSLFWYTISYFYYKVASMHSYSILLLAALAQSTISGPVPRRGSSRLVCPRHNNKLLG